MFKNLRRTRMNSVSRELVRETDLHVTDFIYPLFVKEGVGIKQEIPSIPNIYQMSIDVVLEECKTLLELNLKSVLLFGIPDVKDSIGSECCDDNSIICRTIKAIKEKFPQMFVVTDLCFCEYTDHGHCGILNHQSGIVDNEATLKISAIQALAHAKAGADMIAPSGMMDGIVVTLRKALDTHGYTNIPIMSYSTKFASSYYGPFREIAQSSPSFGDRKTYQMDFANRLEAIRESLEDEKQGADILMIKPGLAYLDIIRDIRNKTYLPIAVYNVSGEYAMIINAAQQGLVDYETIVIETLTAFKRAGANIIITYHAKDAARILQNRNI